MSKNFKLIFSGASVLLSLVAFFMFFAPYITLFGGELNGFKAAFHDPFWFGAFFTFLIVLFAMLVSICTLLMGLLGNLLKLKVEGMVETIIICCLALFDLVTAILLFCAPAMCDGADIYSLGGGAIVAAVMMLLLFLVKCAYIVLPKVLKK